MSLKSKIQSYLGRLIPRQHRHTFNPTLDNIGAASSLDVNKIHDAISQANAGNTMALFGIFQEMVLTDNYIQALIDSRKRSALKDSISFPPVDKKNPLDVAASKAAEMMFAGYTPNADEVDDWQLAMGALMDGTVWPVVFLSKRYAPSTRPGLRFDLQGLKLVDPLLLDWTRGKLMLADTSDNGNRLGTFHEPDPAQYIKHQGHLLSISGNRGGPLRSLLFWWLFATMNRDFWSRFLDRFGAPFLVGKFNDSDDEGRATLESAFAAASKLLGVVISSETEVDVVQTSGGNATGEAFEKFRNVARKEMAILIAGQNLSSESSSSGMNSGQANLQGDVRDDMLDFDHKRLGMTLLRTVRQFLNINGFTGSVDVVFGGKKATDIQALGSALANFKNAGLIVADESLADLSAEAGLTIVRDLPPAPVLTLSATDDPIQDPIHLAAAKLSRLMRASLAPVRSILAESQSPEDLEDRLSLFFADLSLADRSQVTDDLLATLAANGAANPFP